MIRVTQRRCEWNANKLENSPWIDRHINFTLAWNLVGLTRHVQPPHTQPVTANCKKIYLRKQNVIRATQRQLEWNAKKLENGFWLDRPITFAFACTLLGLTRHPPSQSQQLVRKFIWEKPWFVLTNDDLSETRKHSEMVSELIDR